MAQTLEDQGISLGSDDLVSVNLEERVCDGMQIVVSRVTYQDVTVTEEIPYETTTNKDANLDKGKTIVEVEARSEASLSRSARSLSTASLRRRRF